MIDGLREFVYDEEGLTSVEYALLLSLLVGVTIGVWKGLGGSVAGRADSVATVLRGPSTASATGSTTSHPWWWWWFHRR